ncbi:hypothetical protein HMPREF1556_01869 [Porphyromonas sp. oral taxon 278 str. W7784]|nr:hypothetical protein HMPREF1556_01869 [Porphyromonas sp. oral taxon 278 str. W7784]
MFTHAVGSIWTHPRGAFSPLGGKAGRGALEGCFLLPTVGRQKNLLWVASTTYGRSQ